MTQSGKEIYHITKAQLRTAKRVYRILGFGTWQSLAARPAVVAQWIDKGGNTKVEG